MRAIVERAIASQELVRIFRDIPEADELEGYVMSAGTRWILLAQFERNMFDFDGYVAIRLADITDVECLGVPSNVEGRILKHKGKWPPPAIDVPLSTTSDLVRTAGELSPFVQIHIEREDASICFVGQPVYTGPREVALHEITPDAQWREGDATLWEVDEITRIDFLTHYDRGLALVTPPRPENG